MFDVSTKLSIRQYSGENVMVNSNPLNTTITY